jgi:hypothetical protein
VDIIFFLNLIPCHFIYKALSFIEVEELRTSRPSQQVGLTSDYIGNAAALIPKICVKKIIKIYSRQGAASKMFRDTSAN